MATVTGFTATRMLAMENATIIDGNVSGDDLILVTKGGTQINAGSVRGPTGATGAQGVPGTPGAGVPTGAIMDFPKLTGLPAGWLVCDGSIKNIVDHPDLAAYLGTSYGGDGVTTFGLPNYAGLVRVGRDPAQAEFDTTGESGGAKTHTLTTAQLPIHSHPDTLAAPNHTHPMAHVHGSGSAKGFITDDDSGLFDLAITSLGNGIGPVIDRVNTAGVSTPNTSGASATALSGSVGNTGSGSAHNNLQPYRVVITAIKT